jgi:serine/threonine-protein kinase
VTSDVVGVLAMFASVGLAGGAFALTQAQRLLALGFRHGDLAPAFQVEQETLREERAAGRTRPVLRMLTTSLRALAGFGATLTAILAPFAFTGAPSLDLVPGLTLLTGSATIVATLGWLVALQSQRDVDAAFWRRVWTGRAGAFAFAVVRRFAAPAPVAANMTHRATELSLGLAAEQLFDSLPRDVRASLSDIPSVLARLQTTAEALRERLADTRAAYSAAQRQHDDEAIEVLRHEEEQLSARHRDAVAAMETLRLNLLRLHAGQISVEGVTTQVACALDLADDIRRLAEARQEVDDVFGAAHAA